VATGIIVFGHGSSIASANEAVRAVAADAARAGGWELYETAFLEADPRLDVAVARIAHAGADEVLVLPYFLTLGIHLQRDLPKLVDELARRHGVAIRIAARRELPRELSNEGTSRRIAGDRPQHTAPRV
jgi:sirohydrochlorin ferrochelatase